METALGARRPALAFALLTAWLFAAIYLGAAESPAAAPAPPPLAPMGIIRIAAGREEALTDEAGNKWLPARGFVDGDQMDRPDLVIENTKTPSVYRAERFGMTDFSYKLANGSYTVKLHFAICYEAIDGPGQNRFSLDVEGHVIKDLDIWKKAGGRQRAYIQTVPVTIADEKLDITFTSDGEGGPTICAIEIIRTE